MLAALLAMPPVTALAVTASGRWPNLRESLTIAGGVVLCILTGLLYAEIDWQAPPRLELAEPIAGIPLAFVPEPLGMLFALLASFLWPVTSVYAIGYMRAHGERHQTRFYTAFALSIGATLGIALAANMFTLFVFYELLTLATYPLVTHAGDDQARRAGRLYLGILMGTSVAFLLLAILWTWQLTGTLEFTAGGIFDDTVSPGVLGGLLLLYVFGCGKAALMPFHRWLPAAMVAPTPVSALLHAVAVVKAGVFTILKVVVYLFGVDTVARLPVADALAVIAAVSIIAASLIAMTRDNLKARLAYSTISQLGYIVLGAMLGVTAGVVGGGMHIVMHAFGKITLFFCAGAILVAAHRTRVSELDGLGRRMPLTMGAFLIGALSVVGLPPFAGTWSKWLLVQATLDSGMWLLTLALLLSSLLNVAYLLVIPIRGFFRAPAAADAAVREAPLPSLLAIAITALGCATLFFWVDPLYRLAGQVVR